MGMSGPVEVGADMLSVIAMVKWTWSHFRVGRHPCEEGGLKNNRAERRGIFS